MNKIVIIDDDLCVGCGKCVNICPKKILYIQEPFKKCRVSEELKCGKSGCCEKICQQKAVKIIK